MKPAAGPLLCARLIPIALVLISGAVVGPAPVRAAPSPAAADTTGFWLKFLPGYRYASTSGFPARVGEYDGLYKSGGGDLLVHWGDRANRERLDYHGSFTSHDEYESDGKLRLGRWFSLAVEARSLVHHLEKTLFGINWSPDDISRSEGIPDAALFGIKKSLLSGDVRLAVPRTPLTLFARGGLQRRQGLSELRFYDMGGDPTCGSCHSVSRYQPVKYETQTFGGGFELRLLGSTVTYEHLTNVGRNRVGTPVDVYGSTLSSPDDELPPGVPDTPTGSYVHNVVPGHRADSDAARLHAPMPHDLIFDGGVAGGRTRNTYTDHRQSFVNGDATLAWRPRRWADVTVDLHQQNLINKFTPGYPLYGNPSLHQTQAGLRVERALTSLWRAAVHYGYRRTSRSNADLWPQFYSPDNSDLQRVVPRTVSHTAGVELSLRRPGPWAASGGYEWTRATDPGYLTDPRHQQRVSLMGSVAPARMLRLMETFHAAFQTDFPKIRRKNQLYLSTTSATVQPVADWSIGLAYALGADRLKTDLIYGTDPPYTESLVPYDATDQSVQASSEWLLQKRLQWNVELRYAISRSRFKPSPAAAPADTLPLYSPVGWASAFSKVDVPQFSAGTTLDYHGPMGIEGGVGGSYASYRDRVHPERTGYLRSFSVFAGKSW